MMAQQEMRVVREVLESAVTHSIASRVLFESLTEHAVPVDVDDVIAFVHGPLSLRLVSQLGADAAMEMVAQLDRLLRRRKKTGSFYDLDIQVEDEEAREPTITRALAVAIDDPVPLVVVSASHQLAVLLDIALGEDCVRVLSARDESEIRHVTFAEMPLIALVDGENPPDDAASVAAALTDLPSSVVRVIWAADVSSAGPLTRALTQRNAYSVCLRRSDGLEPLLDLIRSRQRTSELPT